MSKPVKRNLGRSGWATFHARIHSTIAKNSSVSEVQPYPANDVLELDTGLLLPLVDACVLDVDLERGRIVVATGFAAAE